MDGAAGSGGSAGEAASAWPDEDLLVADVIEALRVELREQERELLALLAEAEECDEAEMDYLMSLDPDAPLHCAGRAADVDDDDDGDCDTEVAPAAAAAAAMDPYQAACRAHEQSPCTWRGPLEVRPHGADLLAGCMHCGFARVVGRRR